MNKRISKKPDNLDLGFTIVELLVVIVVIGILASITVVSYTGVTRKASVVSLQSDLINASKQLKLFQITDPNNDYPTANVCPSPGATEICLNISNENTMVYTPNNSTNPKSFVVSAINGIDTYRVTDNSKPSGPWIPGAASTPMDGKYVYGIDLFTTYMQKNSNTSISSPQGAAGLDLTYPAQMSLVNPRANPSVDFSEYPAQMACMAIGGRLPTVYELASIYSLKTSNYGNNFKTSMYLSATENTSLYSLAVFFTDGLPYASDKNSPANVRCVAS